MEQSENVSWQGEWHILVSYPFFCPFLCLSPYVHYFSGIVFSQVCSQLSSPILLTLSLTNCSMKSNLRHFHKWVFLCQLYLSSDMLVWSIAQTLELRSPRLPPWHHHISSTCRGGDLPSPSLTSQFFHMWEAPIS